MKVGDKVVIPPRGNCVAEISHISNDKYFYMKYCNNEKHRVEGKHCVKITETPKIYLYNHT